MARIRTIKPDFFRHEGLFDAEKASGLPLRIAFAGLWTVADREGRFKWRPRTLKTDVLPYDEVDFGAVLDALAEHGFIVRYEVGGDTLGHIPKFAEHQYINQREPASNIPAPEQSDARTDEDDTRTCLARAPEEGEGKGREGRGSAHVRARSPASISSDWEPSTEDAEAAVAMGLPKTDLRREAQRFRDYWKGEGAAKADWSAAWRAWVSRTCETKGYAPPGEPGTGPPSELRWLPADSPEWPLMDDRSLRETGKHLRPLPSKAQMGKGAYVPLAWSGETGERA